LEERREKGKVRGEMGRGKGVRGGIVGCQGKWLGGPVWTVNTILGGLAEGMRLVTRFKGKTKTEKVRDGGKITLERCCQKQGTFFYLPDGLTEKINPVM